LHSIYKQYIRSGGILGYKKFFKSIPVPGCYSFDPDVCCYDRLIEYYQQKFGEDNVLVLTFGEFVANTEIFCNNILEFIGFEYKHTKIQSQ
jgi:hypothetical protein